jgi:hypothetical protein
MENKRRPAGCLGCGCLGLIFCLFMGVTAISMGVGAAYPPINLIAKPLVCADGEMTYQQSSRNPLPGRTYLSASWTCVEPSGVATPIEMFPLSLYSGAFYGLLLFGVLGAFALVVGLLRRGGAAAQSYPR